MLGNMNKIQIAIIVLFNLVAIFIVASAHFAIKGQEIGLRIVLPKYTYEFTRITVEDAKNVEKEALVKIINGLGNEYRNSEGIYKKALETRKSLIYILGITLVLEILLLTILSALWLKNKRQKNTIESTQHFSSH